MKFISNLLPIFFVTVFMTSCGDRSPERIFKAVLNEDQLKSAKVIHAEDQDFGECCIWLHFTVDSVELAEEIKDCTEYPLGTTDTTEHEAIWFNPNKLGRDAKCFQRHRDRIMETFYANHSMTEVYYQNYLQ